MGEDLGEALGSRAATNVCWTWPPANGNAALAAARRWCDVTGIRTMYRRCWTRARERALAERLPIKIEVAGRRGAALCGCISSTAVTSTFGAMFAPQHEKPANEMLRVCRSGGKIGLANWTPEGFIGSLFKVIGRHLPPPTGLKSPALWGTKDHLVALFGHQATIHAEKRNFTMRYRSDEHWIENFQKLLRPGPEGFRGIGCFTATIAACRYQGIDRGA